MSPVISNDPRWNEEWHEELLSISLLGKSPLQREELKKRIRSIQSEPPLAIEQLREEIKSRGMPDPYCHTVDELKQMCRERDLLTTGNKDDLVMRLFEPQIGRSIHREFPLPSQPHSYSNYNYVICNLIERGLIEEDDRGLRLTSLGEWIAKSKLGSLFGRDSFLKSFVCEKCSSPVNVVLLTPLLNTIDVKTTNTKGQIYVDLRCPTCGAIGTQHHLGFSKDGLVKFYYQAIAELGRLVKLKAQRI